MRMRVQEREGECVCWIERKLENSKYGEEERAKGGKGFEEGGSEGRRGVCWRKR